MHNKSFSIAISGHTIEVRNIFKPLKLLSHEELLIDGNVVSKTEDFLFRSQSELSAITILGAQAVTVSARVAPKASNPLRVGFQVFVDGKLIGGDRKLKEEKITSSNTGGIIRYTVMQGIPIYGIPFAFAMLIADFFYGVPSIKNAIIYVLGHGILMSLFMFYVMKKR